MIVRADPPAWHSGTLDDPKQFAPKAAIYTIDKQAFHQIPDGMATFERLPARG